MDLCEVANNKNRHPWELARVNSLRTILNLRDKLKDNLRILDVGCGDAFICGSLFEGVGVKSIEGVDIHLSNAQIKRLSAQKSSITLLYNTFDNLKEESYDLIFLLDVIEHVKDDRSFLSEVINRYLDDKGYILITAPAFEILFSSHDIFLKHYRRYNLQKLYSLFNDVHIECLSSGYLFFSLIPLRFLLLCCERFFGGECISNKGVGYWKHGKLLTKAFEQIFTIENNLLIAMSRFGAKAPGLTVWALCKKQQL